MGPDVQGGKSDSDPGFSERIPVLLSSHQPPVTATALTGFVGVYARAGTDRTFGPVLRVRAPGNSAAAGHPRGVGNCTHDSSFDRAGIGPAAAHAPGVRMVFHENAVRHKRVSHPKTTDGQYPE